MRSMVYGVIYLCIDGDYTPRTPAKCFADCPYPAITGRVDAGISLSSETIRFTLVIKINVQWKANGL
jgi:hypothetical protein